jgi:hypothetical protein
MHRLKKLQLPLAGLFLLAILLVFLDEIVLLHTRGIYVRRLECPTGNMLGSAAQAVCIKEETVVKIAKPCTSMANVMQCKWKYWKQLYTNRLWESTYADMPFIPKVTGYDPESGGVIVERIKHNKTVKPDYAYNLEQMQLFDQMLEKHNQIVMDVHPDTNVFLDEKGRVKLIDFNLLPWWTWPYIEKYEKHCVLLHPFRNIYGSRKMFKWITPPSPPYPPRNKTTQSHSAEVTWGEQRQQPPSRR